MKFTLYQLVNLNEHKVYDMSNLKIKKSKRKLLKMSNAKTSLRDYGKYIVLTALDKFEKVNLVWKMNK